MALSGSLAPALSVFEYNMVGYRRTWRGSVLSSFVLPVLFVIGFGLSVARIVDVGGRLGPVAYRDFIVPGIMASTALQVAFGESAYPVMSRFTWIRTYHAMVATPLRPGDIIAGDLMFMVFRLVSSSLVFLAIAVGFGSVHSWWALTVPLSCALTGLSLATPVVAYAAHVDNDGRFALLHRFVVLPMTLFAGVFFPVQKLPEVVRWLAYSSPLYHGVELTRAATLPGLAAGPLALLGHVLYLAAWAVGGFLLARVTYRRRLVG